MKRLYVVPIAAVLGTLALLWVFSTQHGGKLAFGEFLEVCVLGALFFVTSYYAIATYRIATATKELSKETRRQRLAENEPKIWFNEYKLTYPSHPGIQLQIYNVGRGTALRIQCSLIPERGGQTHQVDLLLPTKEKMLRFNFQGDHPEGDYRIQCVYDDLTEEAQFRTALPFKVIRSRDGTPYVSHFGRIVFKRGEVGQFFQSLAQQPGKAEGL